MIQKIIYFLHPIIIHPLATNYLQVTGYLCKHYSRTSLHSLHPVFYVSNPDLTFYHLEKEIGCCYASQHSYTEANYWLWWIYFKINRLTAWIGSYRSLDVKEGIEYSDNIKKTYSRFGGLFKNHLLKVWHWQSLMATRYLNEN